MSIYSAVGGYIGAYIMATFVYWVVGGLMHRSWRIHKFRTKRAKLMIHGFAFMNFVYMLVDPA